MQFVELVMRYLFPNTKLFHYERIFKVPVVGKIMISPLRLVGRTIAVAVTTVLVRHSLDCLHHLLSKEPPWILHCV